MFTQKMSEVTRDVPGPIYEMEDRKLQNMKGLNERNFGFGERIDFSLPANENPGPKYELRGFCDRFEKTKEKNTGER